jgi:hypothetical protein
MPPPLQYRIHQAVIALVISTVLMIVGWWLSPTFMGFFSKTLAHMFIGACGGGVIYSSYMVARAVIEHRGHAHGD